MGNVEKEASPPSLGELLIDPEALNASSAPEYFSIESIELAAWAARKVVDARTRMDQRSALAASYKARIDAWLTSANKEDADSVEFLSSRLKPFAEREIGRLRRSRTLFLPGAKLALRKKPDRLEVIDEAKAILDCERLAPEAIVIKKSISKAILKTCHFDGEIPGSMRFIPGEDELYIEADAPAIPDTDRKVA